MQVAATHVDEPEPQDDKASCAWKAVSKAESKARSGTHEPLSWGELATMLDMPSDASHVWESWVVLGPFFKQSTYRYTTYRLRIIFATDTRPTDYKLPARPGMFKKRPKTVLETF